MNKSELKARVSPGNLTKDTLLTKFGVVPSKKSFQITATSLMSSLQPRYSQTKYSSRRVKESTNGLCELRMRALVSVCMCMRVCVCCSYLCLDGQMEFLIHMIS